MAWQRDVDAESIIYRSLRDIEADEELCINYGRLWFVDTDATYDRVVENDDDFLNKIQIEI